MTLEMVFERDVHKGNLGFGLQGPDFSLCEEKLKKMHNFLQTHVCRIIYTCEMCFTHFYCDFLSCALLVVLLFKFIFSVETTCKINVRTCDKSVALFVKT